MVDNKYLREYAEKAYLQYPGYSLEKARINFPMYYPAIASYYLQLKSKELERSQIDAATILASRVSAEASGAMFLTSYILERDISPILDDVIGELGNLNLYLDYFNDSEDKKYAEDQLHKLQSTMQQNHFNLSKLSSMALTYKIYCTLIGGKSISSYKDALDKLNQINIKYQKALTGISILKGRLYGK